MVGSAGSDKGQLFEELIRWRALDMQGGSDGEGLDTRIEGSVEDMHRGDERTNKKRKGAPANVETSDDDESIQDEGDQNRDDDGDDNENQQADGGKGGIGRPDKAKHYPISLGTYLPLNHEIYPAFVRLPSYLSSDVDLVLPQNPRTPVSLPCEDAEHLLMPMDTDDDALLAELMEEDKLEVRDRVAEQAFEKELWLQNGSGQRRRRKRQRDGDLETMQVPARRIHSLKFKPPDLDGVGRVKSEVFIYDSD